VKHTREELEQEACRRNREASSKPGKYQHWLVLEDGYGPFLTCEWRRVPLGEQIRRWLVEHLGGELP
jgi:hypothetical protein